MLNVISYEAARKTGILNAQNEVTYSIGIDGRKNSARAIFTLLESVEATVKNHCCFLWDVSVFQPKGIVTRIERDGVIAELVQDGGLTKVN